MEMGPSGHSSMAHTTRAHPETVSGSAEVAELLIHSLVNVPEVDITGLCGSELSLNWTVWFLLIEYGISMMDVCVTTLCSDLTNCANVCQLIVPVLLLLS